MGISIEPTEGASDKGDKQNEHSFWSPLLLVDRARGNFKAEVPTYAVSSSWGHPLPSTRLPGGVSNGRLLLSSFDEMLGAPLFRHKKRSIPIRRRAMLILPMIFKKSSD